MPAATGKPDAQKNPATFRGGASTIKKGYDVLEQFTNEMS